MIRTPLSCLLILSTTVLASCGSPEGPAPDTEPPEVAEVAVAESAPAAAEEPATTHFSRFGEGAGPTLVDGTYRVLDGAGSAEQSNAIAFDREHEGAYESVSMACNLRVLEGGDGGAIAFLSTREYSATGPAPYLASWVEPNLDRTFAVGIDVHNPKSTEPFSKWGNYQDLPQREISLHWDGRELVKRVAPSEFRGDFAECEVRLQHVIGGTEVTVRIGAEPVYDRYFVAGMLPYESRLAFGAGTRKKATTEFDVRDVSVTVGEPAAKIRKPASFEVFNHVLTDNSKITFESEVELPPLDWAVGRVILTLDIHDAGKMWDEWDRNGEVSIWDKDGNKVGIVPFITSYRTECHWEVDVTHFRPWLTGKTKFEICAGTKFYKNRGYMMSVSLDFYHGTPELEPYAVVPLWHGTAKYKTAENHFTDFFTPKRVAFDAETKAARVFSTTTGHSQIGEFSPSGRSIVFVPDGGEQREARFENTLWKTDVYLNPNRPQYGTWKYSRAGWAPGDVVWPWWVDLTPHLTAGGGGELRYEPQPYDFSGAPKPPEQKQINKASHVVRSYLILYRTPTTMSAAPNVRVGEIVKGGNAAKAGIKAGDFFVEYDGQAIDSLEDLRAAYNAASAAKKASVVVVVYRHGERITVQMASGRLGVQIARR